MEKFVNSLLMGASWLIAIIGTVFIAGIIFLMTFIPLLPNVIVSAVGYCVFFVLFGIMAIVAGYFVIKIADSIVFGMAFARFAKKANLKMIESGKSPFKEGFRTRLMQRALIDEEIHTTVKMASGFHYKNIFVHGIYDNQELYDINDEDGEHVLKVPRNRAFHHA